MVEMFGFGKKKKKPEMKLEDIGKGMVKVSVSKSEEIISNDDFYKELDSKSSDDFLKEIGEKTWDLWRTVLKYSIKKHTIKDTRKINQLMTFIENSEISMSVMRALKAQLVQQATILEAVYVKHTGKNIKLLKMLDDCIHIANSEDIKKIAPKRKQKQQYVV